MSVKQAAGVVVVLVLGAVAPRPAGAQIWLPATCGIKPGHQLVNKGMQALRDAFTTKFAEQRAKALKEAETALTQAVTSAGQDKSPAAWYYLGRYYLMTGDLEGADSALSKALALAPDCKDDITLYRRQAWVPVFNAGVQAWQAGNTDSAIASFERANRIYQAEPMGFIYLASLFIGREAPDTALRATDPARYRRDSVLFAGRIDSAAKYFRLAVPAAADPKFAKERRDALFNIARVYHAGQRSDEAAAAYRDYLAAYPNDIQAMAALAAIYTQTGRRDSATALYDRILVHADSADAADLFAAAQAVLSAIPAAPDTATLAADCRAAQRKQTPGLPARQIAARCQPAAADTMRQFHAVADPQYRLAARLYEAGLAKNPYHRDALYNLAGISYLVGDTSRVLPLAQRLYAVDPMNRSTLAKIAGGWQLLGKKDSVLHYLQVADSLPVEVTVNTFSARDSAASLDGTFTNLRPSRSPTLVVTFEFLDARGGVVAAQTDTVPALEPAASRGFRIKATGQGIVAWRYRRS
jgi:tetratricopeptide (TPR) repeat protein